MEDRDYESSSIEDLRDVYLNITGEVLPQLARENNWVIRFDHCFQRVVLDNVFGEIWYNCLDKDSSKPAYKQIERDNLISAVKISREMVREGGQRVEELNEKSLQHRDKA